MDSEQSAFLASQGRHNRYMIFGKKQHYVEVYQCSGDDMNLVLASAGDPSSATNGNEAPAVTTSTASTVSNSASIAAALMQQHHHHQQPGMLPTPAPHPQPQVPTSSSSSLTGLDPSLLLNNPYLVQQQQQQQQNLAAQMQMQMQFPGLANHPGLMQPHLAALAHLPRPGVPQASQGALLQNPYLAQAQQRLILQQQQQQHQQNAAVQALLARPQFAHFGAGGGGLLPQPLPATATAAAAAQSYAAAAAAAAAGKRSFDQAFTAQPQAGADSLAKRAATYSANHTISANPTTYHTSQ